ncbi:MAG TPA: helix-turn-helix transcriptional regulator [Gammaproteobacteria bacterium]
MKISDLLTDEAILDELGARIASRRLELELTQAELAEQAGIAKRTLERIEAGNSAQLSSLVRILRVLEALPGLEVLIPAAGPRPMDQLKRKGKVRQRAPGRRGSEPPGKPWSWDDEA